MSEVELHVFGVDERDQYGLQLAFRRHDAHKYVIDADGSGDKADIVLIDGDAVGAAAVVERELEREPRRPVVLMTLINKYDVGDDPVVKILAKPVGVADTLAALDSFAASVSGRPVEPPAEKTPPLFGAPAERNGAGPPPAAADQETTSAEPARPSSSRPQIPPSALGPRVSPNALPPGPGQLAAAEDLAMVLLEEEKSAPPADAIGANPLGKPGASGDKSGPAISLSEAAEKLLGLASSKQSDRIVIPPDRAHEMYDPAAAVDGCLAALVATAHRLGRRTALVVESDGVCYDPGPQTFTSTGYFDWLDDLSRAGTPCAEYLVDDAAGLYLAEFDRRGVASIVWRSALLAGGGRLRFGIQPSEPLILSYWPDLTQLDGFEGLLSIIAAIAAREPTIVQLVDEGYGRHKVNAAVGALSAINALVVSPEIHQAWQARRDPAARGLLGRFLSWEQR